MLCEKTGMSRVFFFPIPERKLNQCAIKVGAQVRAGEKRERALSHHHAGKQLPRADSTTTLAATCEAVFHRDFTPLTAGFHHVPAGDLAGVQKLLDTYPTAAVMIEIVQGVGGVIPLDQTFVKELAALLCARDVALICDEVQIGNGESGMLYGYMNYGIQPDIFTTAKGLGGGAPIGATVLGERVKDVLTPGTHGSTFGGNPVCCAGAVSILSRLNEETLAGVRERSAYIVGELTAGSRRALRNRARTDARCGDRRPARRQNVIRACMERGVLVISAKEKVRLLPALNIPMPLLERAVQILKEVCSGGQEGI